jgi:hypothetical protein
MKTINIGDLKYAPRDAFKEAEMAFDERHPKVSRLRKNDYRWLEHNIGIDNPKDAAKLRTLSKNVLHTL